MTALRREVPSLDQPLYGAGFGAAFMRFWRRGLDFRGRSSRSEYWWISCPGSCLCALAYYGVFTVYYAFGQTAYYVFLISTLVFFVATAVPYASAGVRRLHDANFSGWWMLLGFVPLGDIALLRMLWVESNPRGARFDRAER